METARPTPLRALELPELPTEDHFRRDHFGAPKLDASAWSLAIAGAVSQPLRLTLAELQALPKRTITAVLECAGHRRAEFDPPARGIAWQAGAVGEARWGGSPLHEALALARPSANATGVVLEGADRGPFAGLAGTFAFARCLPLAKALEPDTLLAWEMNGTPLSESHGAPLRAVVPGWYATDSVKWLTRIDLVTEAFDGPWETLDYRVDGERLTGMPVHALITSPADGDRLSADVAWIRGVAWCGQGGVAAIEVRIDDGPWVPAEHAPPASVYGLTRWRARVALERGGRTIAARASDLAGSRQPETPRWNPRGYANSSVHRVTVDAE